MAVLMMGWVWGRWADERRRATYPRVLARVSAAEHAELSRIADQTGCTLSEFVRRGVVMYRIIAEDRDESYRIRILNVDADTAKVRDLLKSGGWIVEADHDLDDVAGASATPETD